MTTNTMTIWLKGESGDEISMEVPSVWEICPQCSGDGRVDNPAFENGISGEEWANEWEDEERELYLSGAYDVRCDACNCSGKVRAPLLSALTDAQRQAYEDYLDDESYYQAQCAAERRAERYC